MISGSIVPYIMLVGGVATFFALLRTFIKFSPISVIFVAFLVTFMVVMTAGTVDALSRVKSEQPKYYAVYDIGTTEAPHNVAALNGRVFDITGVFYIVLYNPELYYLEEQSYTCPCKGWCLVTENKAPTYRVVPRSLVEVQ